MANPITIPEIPGGWCASLDRLVTFIELVNLNFDIMVESWDEAFSEELTLPGVPPITLWAPGVQVPAVPGFSRPFRTASPPEERAWVGNRFPIGLGGLAIDGKYEFPGFGGVDIDPRKVVIPGRDPMTIIMEFVRVNYEIITKKMEERSLAPVINWTLTTYDCQFPPTNDLNRNNERINDTIPPPDSVDGPPEPDSEVPTFGPDSGGPSSCWELPEGVSPVDGVVTMNSTGRVELRCSCAVPVTAGQFVTAGVTATARQTSGSNFGPGAAYKIGLWIYASEEDCAADDPDTRAGALEGVERTKTHVGCGFAPCTIYEDSCSYPQSTAGPGFTATQSGVAVMAITWIGDEVDFSGPWLSTSGKTSC